MLIFSAMFSHYSLVSGRLLLCLIILLSGCQKSGVESIPPRGMIQPLQGTLGRLDGGVIRLEEYRGRVTILLFFATYDLASQVAAQRLVDFVHEHAPRVNALAVALEIPKNIELVRSFRSILAPPFEVVMASMAIRSGSFGGYPLRSVPTIWVLDEKGRMKFEFAGSPSIQQLGKAVNSLQ